MDCREAEELFPAYALNALDPQEEALVEAHVGTCPWCAALLREQLGVAVALSQVAETLQPPERLKGRTLRTVEKEMRRERPGRPWFAPQARLLQGAVASAAILIAAAVIGVGVHMSNQMNGLQEENARLVAQMSQQAEDDRKLVGMFMGQLSANYIMSSPDRQVLLLEGDKSVPKVQGMLLMGFKGDAGVLIAKGLEPPSENMAYRVWLRRDGQRVAVGHLAVDQAGWGALTLWPDQPLTLFQQVWVTEEQAEGRPDPDEGPKLVLWGTIVPAR